MKKCHVCGVECDDNAEICLVCGAELKTFEMYERELEIKREKEKKRQQRKPL